jgi:hypothetical protein
MAKNGTPNDFDAAFSEWDDVDDRTQVDQGGTAEELAAAIAKHEAKFKRPPAVPGRRGTYSILRMLQMYSPKERPNWYNPPLLPVDVPRVERTEEFAAMATPPVTVRGGWRGWPGWAKALPWSVGTGLAIAGARLWWDSAMGEALRAWPPMLAGGGAAFAVFMVAQHLLKRP